MYKKRATTKIGITLLIATILSLETFKIFNFNWNFKGIETVPLLGICLVFVISIYLRLKRTQMLISFVKPNSITANLQGSSIGYLTNLILPFRLGEIARSYFLSKYLGISLGFTLGTIAFDRGLDLIMISFALLGQSVIRDNRNLQVFSQSEISIILVGSVVFVGMIALIARRKLLLLSIQKITASFNQKIRDKLRNSLWGIILIFQQILRNRKFLRNYISVVILSWVFTYIAIIALATYLQKTTFPGVFIREYIPFLSFVVLNGNNNFSDYKSKILELSSIIYPLEGSHEFLKAFSASSWQIFTLPYLGIGILTIFSFILQVNFRRIPRTPTNDRNSIQLLNYAPTNYLESFFTKEKIIERIHLLSVREGFKVIEYFKGGSDAVTLLVKRDSVYSVLKVSGPLGVKKLMAQDKWLQDTNSNGVVKAIRSEVAQDFFLLELQYINESIPLFEYIHTKPIEQSKSVILQAIRILEKDVYSELTWSDIHTELEEYIENSLIKRLNTVASKSPEFQKFFDSRNPVIINGQSYLDLNTVIEKIRDSDKCMELLSSMNISTKGHGDFTVDNVLVRNSTGLPVLIDPSDDNEIRGPLFDFSRLMQSLLGGYEFLNLKNFHVTCEEKENRFLISFPDIVSSQYQELSHWLITDVCFKMLKDNEIRAIKFHVGVFYSRMLTHRLAIDPTRIFQFAAVSVKYLNEFYEEANDERS